MHFRLCAGVFALVSIGLALDIRVVEEIVAKVNGDIITRGDIARTRQTLEAQLKQEGLTGAALDKAIKEREKDALREQIDQLLLVQHGKDMNINVDGEVTKRVAQIQLDSKIADQDKFHDYIREKTGMSFEDFKAQIKNSLLTQRVIGQEVSSKINVPRSDLQKYYEEHKKEFVREEQVFLREILISTDGKTPEQSAQAEKRAKELVARGRKGEKFGELAKQYSDAETKENFGELPAYKRGQLRKEIEDVVFKEKKGYVTDPIRMPNGFEILKIEERYAAGQAPFEEVENEITEKLYMPRMEPKVRELLTKLREDAFLEIKPGYFDSGAAPNKDTSWKDPAQLKPETTTKEEVAARKHKKKLLWVVPIPGTSTGKKVETAKRPGESTPPPAAGSADRPASAAADPAAAGSPPPIKP
ncbi:MAG: PpiC-type peptidyl-prolyl cis-trans isomerase [Bryobacterales bacterium]|nr:PpiC-type peptidyl-prolyl cis-trans isomerase [Bryobacterales bacterium]